MSFLSKLFRKKKNSYTEALPEMDQEGLDEELNEDEQSFDLVGREEALPKASEEEEVYEVVEREIHPAKIICPDCGGITLEGLEFCDKCGGELL